MDDTASTHGIGKRHSGAALTLGGAVAVGGGWLVGAVAAVAGAAIGAGAGFAFDHSRSERAARTFERNRIAALERGLQLRGEHGATPGTSREPFWVANIGSGAESAPVASAWSTPRSTSPLATRSRSRCFAVPPHAMAEKSLV